MYHLPTIAFIELVSYLGNDIYLPALPTIMNTFSLSEMSGQFSIFIWLLSCTIFQLIFGFWFPHMQKRTIIAGSFFILAVSATINALTTSYSIFLMMRFLQGMSVAAVTTAGYASIYENYGESEGSRLITMLSMITVMAPALGPPLGSLLLTQFDWPMIFLFLGFLGGISCLVSYLFIPNTVSTASAPMQSLVNNSALFYITIFLSAQMTFILLLWICESPIILMIVNDIDETTYGQIMLIIFSSYALGALAVSQAIKRIPSIIITTVSLLMYIVAIAFIIFSQDLYYELGGVCALMFWAPSLSNRFSRLVIATKTHSITKTLSIFSFWTCIAALLACGVSTFSSIHTLNLFAAIAAGNVTLASIILVLVLRARPHLQKLQ